MALIKSLEKSILEILPVIETGGNTARNRDIFVRYHVLEGGDWESMRDVGQNFGITRESVRQALDRVVTEIRSLGRTPAVISQAMDFVAMSAPGSAARITDELIAAGLLDGRSTVRTVLAAADIFNLDCLGLRVVKFGTSDFVCTAEQAKALKPILSRAIKEISHNGAADMDEIVIRTCAEMMGEERRREADRAKKRAGGSDAHALMESSVRSVKEKAKAKAFKPIAVACSAMPVSAQNRLAKDVLGTRPETVWLAGRWAFFGDEKGRNRLLNRLQDVFSVMAEVDVLDFIEGVKRYWKKNTKIYSSVPPKDVVIEIIRSMDGYAVDGRGIIRCTLDLEPAEELKPFELKMLDVFRRTPSSVIQEKTLENEIVQSDTDKYSFSMVLNHSPLLVRVGRGAYALVGKPKELKIALKTTA